jgi:hypothetical protein
VSVDPTNRIRAPAWIKHSTITSVFALGSTENKKDLAATCISIEEALFETVTDRKINEIGAN